MFMKHQRKPCFSSRWQLEAYLGSVCENTALWGLHTTSFAAVYQIDDAILRFTALIDWMYAEAKEGHARFLV